MSEPGSRRGRVHDAEGTREAILDAAEKVFTEHGFDGARIDAIAKEAGYNKSLIFQYFGDKVGLYAEVTRRADREMSKLQGGLLAPLLEDAGIASDPHKFRLFLETIIGALFDYLAEHPRLFRIIHWEAAENWQTYRKIFSQFEAEDTQDVEQFDAIFRIAYQAGLLRSDYPFIIQLTLALQTVMAYFAWTPMYQLVLPGEDFSSAEALKSARTYIVNFIVSGIMVDPADTSGKT